MPTTEPQTNQSIVNAIAERVDALRKKPCPHPLHSNPELGDTGRFCLVCNGTGTITDPRYQAALELLNVWQRTLLRPASHIEIRDVESWPDCAVVALFEGAIRKIHDPKLYAFLVNWKHDPNYGSVKMLADLYTREVLPFHWPDPDDVQGLGKALLEALNAN